MPVARYGSGCSIPLPTVVSEREQVVGVVGGVRDGRAVVQLVAGPHPEAQRHLAQLPGQVVQLDKVHDAGVGEVEQEVGRQL